MNALLCLVSAHLTNKHKQVESHYFHLTKVMCFIFPFLLSCRLCSEFYLSDKNEPISISLE
jgi:hypothetical protein